MNLRFIQRQAGGPRVLQQQMEVPGILTGVEADWQDIPLVEEWRAVKPETVADDHPSASRIYRDMD